MKMVGNDMNVCVEEAKAAQTKALADFGFISFSTLS